MLSLQLACSCLLPSPPAQPVGRLLTPRGAVIGNVAPISMVSGRREAIVRGAGMAAALAAAGTPMASFAATPDVYTPAAGSLDGQTILITGANTGLGLESAKRLYAGGARVILTARSQAKADAAAAAVAGPGASDRAIGLTLDLADLSSVRSFPDRLKGAIRDDGIDCLMNNAGVMAIPERLTTADGFERTVGVNHLGHFALIGALLPSLRRAKGGFRVINVSSDAHRFARKEDIQKSLDANLDPAQYSQWGAYGVSKALNVLLTDELQRRFDAAGLRASAVALHPGVVQTDLGRYIVGGVTAGDRRPSEEVGEVSGAGALLQRVVGPSAAGALFQKAQKLVNVFILPVEKGANTQVYLAAAADTAGDRTARGGTYFDKMKAVKPTDASTDKELARRVWELSEQLTATKIAL